jgi:hypothetical protein
MDWQTRLVIALKDKLVRSPWGGRFLPRYAYNFDAAQLCFLCDCLERTRHVDGAVMEVGTAGGETTLFLNNYLTARGIDKPYFAIDTFDGFTPQDIAVEVNARGKHESDYEGIHAFRVNKQTWYDKTMQLNGVTRVVSVRTDVNEFDLQSRGAIAFCLLDVDLYRPSKKAMEQVYAAQSPGGIIVVDDCAPGTSRWDGALQAYRKFVQANGLPEEIVLTKLGIIRKGPQ